MPERCSEAVLVLAPSPRDAQTASRELAREGIECVVCAGLDELCERIAGAAGAAIVSEELLDRPALEAIAAVLAGQPAWSDFPLLVPSRSRANADDAAHLAALGNVTLMDTPLRLRTLVQAVRAALRARRRQYDARRAIERRDEFLAMLGHELRNPLSAIVLANEHIEEEPADAAIALRILHGQTAQLARIVDDLLDVARVSTGKLQLDRAPLDLEETLTRCVDAFRPRFDAAGLALALEIAGPAPILGDAPRLEQAFGNVLTNCLKYTPRGGRVRVQLAREGLDSVVVEILDTGVGISSEMLPQIFDQFVQVPSTLARSQGGMGVGLTLVRTLIELHGGTVEAFSAGLDQGSRFVIRLPLNEVAAPRAAPRGVDARPRPRRTLVLVEDNDDARELLALSLTRHGHRVLQAADGPSGLAAILAHRPDAAVIDVGLPGMDGYAVARAVREALGDDIALVAATGYGQASDRRRALSAGFDVHLTKPMDSVEIQAQIELVLGRTAPATERPTPA